MDYSQLWYLQGIGEVTDCKRYSSVARLLAVTANVQKFCRLARPYSSLPAESDTAKAEILWILETQKDLVKDPKFAQWKRQFNLFQDDRSIWRSRGNADVSYSTKYPILLPRSPLYRTDSQESPRESLPWWSEVHTHGVEITILDC